MGLAAFALEVESQTISFEFEEVLLRGTGRGPIATGSSLASATCTGRSVRSKDAKDSCASSSLATRQIESADPSFEITVVIDDD
jgi:hypothetical protein